MAGEGREVRNGGGGEGEGWRQGGRREERRMEMRARGGEDNMII